VAPTPGDRGYSGHRVHKRRHPSAIACSASVHGLVPRRFMADVGMPRQMTFADGVRLSAGHRIRLGGRHGSRLPLARSRRLGAGPLRVGIGSP
jgi:hypothetical protein